MICGMTAGSLGQLAASPTDLIKVRMQMEGRRRLEGKPPRYGASDMSTRVTKICLFYPCKSDF